MTTVANQSSHNTAAASQLCNIPIQSQTVNPGFACSLYVSLWYGLWLQVQLLVSIDVDAVVVVRLAGSHSPSPLFN